MKDENWISVNDRLPKVGQYVLCFYIIGDIDVFAVGYIHCITTYEYEESTSKSVEWKCDNYEPSVTHWLELPKKPKQ